MDSTSFNWCSRGKPPNKHEYSISEAGVSERVKSSKLPSHSFNECGVPLMRCNLGNNAAGA